MMKKCPYCAEEIQEEAVKCRYCNEFLDESMRPVAQRRADDELPFYLRTSFIVLTFFILPPLALPSVWLHPKIKLAWKLVLTVLIGVVCWLSYEAYQAMAGQFEEATKMMKDLNY